MRFDPVDQRREGGGSALGGADHVVDVVAVAGPIDVPRFHHQPEGAAGREQIERRGRHLGKRGVFLNIGGSVVQRRAVFAVEAGEFLEHVLRQHHRIIAAVGGLKRQVSGASAKEAKQAQIAVAGIAHRFSQQIAAAAAGGAQSHPVFSAPGGIDRSERRLCHILIARLEVASLPSILLYIDAKAAADHHIHARQRGPPVGHRFQPQHVARDILIVVATDIVGIGAGGRGMGDRHARHSPDEIAPLLQRVGDRGELLTSGINIDRVVVGFFPGAQRRGRGG